METINALKSRPWDLDELEKEREGAENLAVSWKKWSSSKWVISRNLDLESYFPQVKNNNFLIHNLFVQGTINSFKLLHYKYQMKITIHLK